MPNRYKMVVGGAKNVGKRTFLDYLFGYCLDSDIINEFSIKLVDYDGKRNLNEYHDKDVGLFCFSDMNSYYMVLKELIKFERMNPKSMVLICRLKVDIQEEILIQKEHFQNTIDVLKEKHQVFYISTEYHYNCFSVVDYLNDIYRNDFNNLCEVTNLTNFESNVEYSMEEQQTEEEEFITF